MAEQQDNLETDLAGSAVGRRRAIKIAGGVGAGAVVWTQPTIRGIARTPAYAAAGSSGAVTNFIVGGGGAVVAEPGPPQGWFWTLMGPFTPGTWTEGGNSVTLALTDMGADTVLSATAAGCTCAITVIGQNQLAQGGAVVVDGMSQPDGSHLYLGLAGVWTNLFTGGMTIACTAV